MGDGISPPPGPAKDPLGRDRVPDRCLMLPVLGIATIFETNSEAVLERVEASFAGWRGVEPPEGGPEDGGPGEGEPRVRILVGSGTEGPPPHPPPTVRDDPPHRVLLHTRGSLGVVDTARGDAVAWVTRELVSDAHRFTHGVLETLTLALLTSRDRTPIHAAAVARDGCGLLLAGESGAGKSTLTYAAARGGLAVLAEDAVFVQAHPRLRVWGMPRHLQLPPDAPEHFPELSGTEPMLLPTGKRKRRVELREAGAAASPPFVHRASVCVLRRGAGRPRILPLSAARVEEALVRRLAPGFDRFGPETRQAARALAGNGGWLLELGDRPGDAVPLLEDVLDTVREARDGAATD